MYRYRNNVIAFVGRSRFLLQNVRLMVQIKFVEAKSDGKIVMVDAPLGKSVLDVAIDYNIDIEGACGGSNSMLTIETFFLSFFIAGELACSTCHVIFTKDVFDKLPAKKEEEDGKSCLYHMEFFSSNFIMSDMLDLASGLTETYLLNSYSLCIPHYLVYF